jgi:hypothetical protein
MGFAARLFLAASLAAMVPVAAGADPAAEADKQQQIAELIGLHDLTTSVSIGNYYLKQESLLAVRSLLARMGREESLGASWKPGNPYWQRAEAMLLPALSATVAEEFASLDWLRPQWQELDNREFSGEELDVLLIHFRSDVGRKQVRIIDHTVSTHVISTLTFTGKIRDIPGVEEERSRMQHVWNQEDDAMRFSIQGATNADGQRFAYSQLGKKYFVTAILKLTGIINRRIDEVAGSLPAQANAQADRVRPLLQEFKGSRA